MSAASIPLRAARGRHRPAAGTVLAGVLSVLVGLSIAVGRGDLALGGVAVGAGIALGVTNWRWATTGLLVYMPFAGIGTALLYPDTAVATVAKDVLFVLPAYLGFFVAVIGARLPVSFPKAPGLLLLVLAGIVLAQTLNPSLPNLVVAAVGLKVWLLYVPLLYLGYHLPRDVGHLERLLGVMTMAAVLPACVGVAEALLVYGGHSASVYSLYGPAAGAMTQEFSRLAVGTGSLLRIPATLASGTQYYVFTTCMVAVAYAWWRLGGPRKAANWLRLAPCGLFATASLLSGARGAFVFLPLLVGVIVVLDRGGRRRLAAPVWLGAGLLVSALVVGTSVGDLLFAATTHGDQQFRDTFVGGVRKALSLTQLGLGTGIDTGASRHVLEAGVLRSLTGGAWQESWWVKALLELGLAGLAVTAAVVGTLLWHTVRSTRGLADHGLRGASAALTAVLIWSAVYGLKAQYLDVDPLNVYFWLFAGLVLRLPALVGDDHGVADRLRPTAAALPPGHHQR
ncbi:MAG TPA: hypothetical protein VGN69_02235 [Solirubrobacteraceae bacterium]|nr:hypothetical protein [Solirubrobacteraceae bacterium]